MANFKGSPEKDVMGYTNHNGIIFRLTYHCIHTYFHIYVYIYVYIYVDVVGMFGNYD